MKAAERCVFKFRLNILLLFLCGREQGCKSDNYEFWKVV